MVGFKKFVVIFLMSFTFGGFLFYAGVVVPIGTDVLGSIQQGFVTRQVTRILNVATFFTLIAIAWEAWREHKHRSRLANRMLLSCTCVIFGCWIMLIFLHPRLDALLDPATMEVVESSSFYRLHRVYLWVSTLQWGCSLPVMWILVGAPLGRNRSPAEQVSP